MNERILKLALDAGLLNYVDNETPRRYFIHGHADLEEVEKFAELIVRECADIVDNAERGGSNDVWDNAVKFIRRDLKEHFGIITSNNSVMEKKSERAAKQHEEGAVGCSGDDVYDNPWKGINMPPPMNLSYEDYSDENLPAFLRKQAE
jgi:hypothetical protein